MISISSDALKRGEQRVSIEKRKTRKWKNSENRIHERVSPESYTCKEEKREIETINWGRNGGGSISLIWTFVEQILGVGSCI